MVEPINVLCSFAQFKQAFEELIYCARTNLQYSVIYKPVGSFDSFFLTWNFQSWDNMARLKLAKVFEVLLVL